MKTFAKSPIGLFILFVGSILLPSCQEGCIDPSACNYNPNAVEDDGTCIYNCTYESEYVPSNAVCSNGEKVFYDVQSQISTSVNNETVGSPHFGEAILKINVRKDRFKTCLNGNYQYIGVAEDVIGFQNVTNRTISFEYLISQTSTDGTKAQYHNKVSHLAPGRAVEINTERNIFPLLDSAPVKVQLSKVHYHR